MHHLSRFGVSLEEDLLSAFDHSIDGLGYQNRSEAIRDLIHPSRFVPAAIPASRLDPRLKPAGPRPRAFVYYSLWQGVRP